MVNLKRYKTCKVKFLTVRPIPNIFVTTFHLESMVRLDILSIFTEQAAV